MHSQSTSTPLLLLHLLILSLTTLPSTQTATPPPPPLHTATLHHHPITPSTTPPQPLAILTYSPHHPHLSALDTFTPPPANTSDTDALTSVVVYLGGGSGYRSTVTATCGFHAPYKGRFRIVLDARGEVVGASWRSYLPTRSVVGGKGGGGEGGRGDFDVLTMKTAPAVVWDNAAKGKGGAMGAGPGAGMAGKEGEEEVVEKSLLQKYWWVLLGVAVLAMMGGGDK